MIIYLRLLFISLSPPHITAHFLLEFYNDVQAELDATGHAISRTNTRHPRDAEAHH